MYALFKEAEFRGGEVRERAYMCKYPVRFPLLQNLKLYINSADGEYVRIIPFYQCHIVPLHHSYVQ